MSVSSHKRGVDGKMLLVFYNLNRCDVIFRMMGAWTSQFCFDASVWASWSSTCIWPMLIWESKPVFYVNDLVMVFLNSCTSLQRELWMFCTFSNQLEWEISQRILTKYLQLNFIVLAVLN